MSPVSPGDKIIFIWEKIWFLNTEYRSSLEVELSLVVIYEWTPTSAIRHLPSEWPFSGDEGGLTDSLKQKKKKDNYPGTIKIESMRRRHSWILRVVIHVRSETEKVVSKMTRLFASKCIRIRLTRTTRHPLGSIATELAPQILWFLHQPTRKEHTPEMLWGCHHKHHVWCPTSKESYLLNTRIIGEYRSPAYRFPFSRPPL